MKATIRQRVVAFHNLMKGDLDFISGKWFYQQNELKNPQRFFLQNMTDIASTTDLESVMDMYVAMFGEDGIWYDSSIIRDARLQTEARKLCFPLTLQQLKIIRKLIDNDEELCFICTGVGGSGKSTFLNIVRQIFDNDCSSCSLSDLSGYNLAEALKYRLIASDELSADDLDNKSIKTIISKQQLQVNPKFEKPYQMKCQSRLFYCCNIPPRIDLDDTGMLRRIVYYEMDKKIDNPDPTLNRKEWKREDLVNICAIALHLDMTDWYKDFEQSTHYYLLKNNSVYRFKSKTTYGEYASACYQAGLKAYAEPKWVTIKSLIQEWGMDKVAPQKPLVFETLGNDEPLPF
ncbi:MAG: hypothetical protein KBS62_03425 [Oscillospiraceae bacterium]|nr:hypothetical protein [Candidatus Ruminococcus equi]